VPSVLHGGAIAFDKSIGAQFEVNTPWQLISIDGHMLGCQQDAQRQRNTAYAAELRQQIEEREGQRRAAFNAAHRKPNHGTFALLQNHSLTPISWHYVCRYFTQKTHSFASWKLNAAFRICEHACRHGCMNVGFDLSTMLAHFVRSVMEESYARGGRRRGGQPGHHNSMPQTRPNGGCAFTSTATPSSLSIN